MAEIQLAKMTDIEGKVDRTYVDAQLATKVNNSQVLTNVPANAKFTDTVYTHPTSHAASMITFDNATSGLTATTIQDAINELKALIDGLGA